MEPFRALLDLVLPRRCIVCGERLNIRERHCCLGCLLDLPRTFYWTWEDNPMSLRFREASALPEARAAALFFYRNGSGYENITRQLKYGYNQAAVIAAELARALGAPLAARALVRVRRTRTQTAVAVDAKAANVAGAFRTARRFRRAAPPRHILLVDDVFTTGATLGEAARTLRAALGEAPVISAVSLACIAK